MNGMTPFGLAIFGFLSLSFARGTGLQVLDAVRQEIAKAAELDAEGRRRLAERLVVRIWMGMLQGGQSG